jgi:hypothetical protein
MLLQAVADVIVEGFAACREVRESLEERGAGRPEAVADLRVGEQTDERSEAKSEAMR